VNAFAQISGIDEIFNLKAANPTYEGRIIEEPSIQSHLKHEEILPFMNVPGRSYITSFDPSTGLHLGNYIADTEAEIGFKIGRAAAAQKSWKKTTLRQRRRVVRSLLKWLVDNQEACARVACRDTGKTCQCFPVDFSSIFDPFFTFSN
jgi:acyl-CoA reductase-like NAD-dependent aldehyde dehydrogenase